MSDQQRMLRLVKQIGSELKQASAILEDAHEAVLEGQLHEAAQYLRNSATFANQAQRQADQLSGQIDASTKPSA